MIEPISHSNGYMTNLLSYIESAVILEKYSHVTQPLSDEQL